LHQSALGRSLLPGLCCEHGHKVKATEFNHLVCMFSKTVCKQRL